MRSRSLLAGLAVVGAALVMGPSGITAQSADVRTLSIYNIHTKESLSVVYRRNGQYVPAAMKQLNHIMRDWRQNESSEMDPVLIDTVWEIHEELGSREPVHLISGFRSSRTNEGLRERGGGQAKNSQHIQGKAADIHFPDVPVKRLRYSALVRERGGVGYYPTSAIPFVHVDTARVRHWPPMPRYELALLFPNGQSKHVPSDGHPITREDVRVAQSKYKELAVQIAEFFDFRRHKPDQGRTVLASLSGPYPVPAPAATPAVPLRPAPSPQLASLTGGPALPFPFARRQDKPADAGVTSGSATSPAPAIAPAPALPPATVAPPAAAHAAASGAKQPATAGKPNDPLGALMARELAELKAKPGNKTAAPAAVVATPAAVAAAPATRSAVVAASVPVASKAPVQVAMAERGGDQIEALLKEKITGETLQAWPSGYAQAPAFDEEHPEELSYRPFPIGPILTEHMGDDHPVLARMQRPDTGRVFEMLEDTDRLFPLTLRPGKQVAELLWASQFNGARVGADTLLTRLKAPDSGLIVQRRVATTAHK